MARIKAGFLSIMAHGQGLGVWLYDLGYEALVLRTCPLETYAANTSSGLMQIFGHLFCYSFLIPTLTSGVCAGSFIKACDVSLDTWWLR